LSRRLDYELELGVFVGVGNSPGAPIPMADAERTSSASPCSMTGRRRPTSLGIPAFGPFLSKNFATTISPWIVTLQALAPFRVPFVRPEEPRALALFEFAAQRDAGRRYPASTR